MKEILLVFLCCLPFITQAASGYGTCERATKIQNNHHRLTPVIVDDSTTLINYIVNCPAKNIVIVYQVTKPITDIKKSDIHKAFNNLVKSQCSHDNFAQYGWLVEARYYDMDMTLHYRLIVEPKYCKNKKQIKY